MIALYIILGLAIGLLTGGLWAIHQNSNHKVVIASMGKEIEHDAQEQQRLTTELQQRDVRLSEMEEQRQTLEAQLSGLRMELSKHIALSEQLENLQQQSQLQFEHIAHQVMERNTERFSLQSQQQMGTLTKQLTDEIDRFREHVEAVGREQVERGARMETLIGQLRDNSMRLGDEARQLTQALKGDKKLQGNWGEMMLERILESSGLQRGVAYELQQTLASDYGVKIKNEESGKQMIPDAIIHYPQQRDIIIDSKVSLVAFASYVAANTDEERKTAAHEHLLAVKRQIDLLSQKDYSAYNHHAQDYVMMFIPAEPAYMLALQEDSHLWEWAYRKKVLLMSPTNLIASLRVTLDIWRRDEQVKNVEKIVERGQLLYEKLATFSDTFTMIGSSIDALQKSYQQAFHQLTAGKGNLVRQAEMLKQMGIAPKKTIYGRLLEEADADEQADS